MVSSKIKKNIVPLHVNGMHGRMLRLPSARKDRQREILVVYGHHALIERWAGLVENYTTYGTVTVPDLPGFGGMDSFYKIGLKPTIDNYADYLAAFIRMKYRRRRVTIVGISFGFVVVTRMLLKYPDLAKKVDLVVSLVGFMHKDDFRFSPAQLKISSGLGKIFSTRVIAFWIRYTFLNSFVIGFMHNHLPISKRRFVDLSPLEVKELLSFDVKLWQANDVRTHWKTTNEFLQIDHCHRGQINVPLWHVYSKGDHYLDNKIVEQHMKVVFPKYRSVETKTKAHTPSILADKKGMAVFLPTQLRRELSKKS